MEAIVGLLRILGFKLIRYSKKIQELLSSAFIFSNIDSFDEDFRQLLQIYYFLGFYRPVPSRKRTLYGLMMLIFVLISLLLGFIKDALKSAMAGKMPEFLVAVAGTSQFASIVTQIVTFMAKEAEIIEMIKALHSLHENEDNALLMMYREKCRLVAKFYRIYLVLSMSMVAILSLCGLKAFPLVLSALYDIYAEGMFYYPLMVANILQGYLIVLSGSVSDLMHVLCMVRAGANFEILCNKLRICAESEDSSENEKNLIACVKYHQRILDETLKIKRIFSYFFMSKIIGTIVTLTCFFFIVMKGEMQEKASTGFLIAVLGLGVSLFQIGSLCFIGQWLKTRSDGLLDASYDCKWYNQSTTFKKTLRIFREVCQREVKTGVIRFDFTHALFYEIMFNSYNYYTNMSHTIKAVGK